MKYALMMLVLVAAACGGNGVSMTMTTDASDVDADVDAAVVDANVPAPGTWDATYAALEQGHTARRASWPAGFFIRLDAGGQLRSSSNGGSTFPNPWSPSADDTSATNWLLFP